jgi:hypothetical protein
MSDSALYHDRSPINFADRLSAPVIFLHGKDDPVVPINQAQSVLRASTPKRPDLSPYIPGREARISSGRTSSPGA